MPRRPERSPEPEAARRIEEAKRSNAAKLDLSGLGLSAIPDSLAQLANLQQLVLDNNQISAIPDSLAQLAKLQLLSIQQPDHRHPGLLAQLAKLQLLSIQQPDQRHPGLPRPARQAATARSRQQPDHRHPGLRRPARQSATALSLLQPDQRHPGLPRPARQAATALSLQPDQRHPGLPRAARQAASAVSIQQPDQRIPDSLAQLTKLTALYLHGNPGLGIPDEILGPHWRSGKDPQPPKILDCYFSRRGASRPLNEVKLILVGQGAVGKTSLVKALTTGKFSSREKRTEGIKISDWICPVSRKENVTVHIWDFGGQEMMHATHQFFLTHRTLYLLVLNGRTGGCDREADYWFRLIRAFGGKDAPVIVVLNRQKTEPFDVNRRGWLETYKGSIRGFAETDCSDKKSITRLKEKIRGELRAMESLKQTFAARWFSIKDELGRMAADYVTFKQYCEICTKHGEADPGRQTLLAGFLHDLGIALNYKDDPRPRFAYVLKPEWVTGGIYLLLHAFVKEKGLFSRSEAAKVLEGKSYPPDATQFILDLMERFELSFPLGDAHRRILIPQLLDDQQPAAAGRIFGVIRRMRSLWRPVWFMASHW